LGRQLSLGGAEVEAMQTIIDATMRAACSAVEDMISEDR